MDNTQKKKLYAVILPLVIFTVFSLAVTFIDRATVTPVDYTDSGAEFDSFTIGFATFNKAFAEKIGYNAGWYTLSSVLGSLSLFVVFIFGCIGAYQWFFSRKNLFLVDSRIITLGLYYLLVLFLYFFFTKVSINFRPVITEAEAGLEHSYPSSHTMLSLCVMITASIEVRKMIKNKAISGILSALCLALALLGVISRLLSGIHWVTDIIGSIILSAALMAFWSFLQVPVKTQFQKWYISYTGWKAKKAK